jgi:hypothetical protein
MSSFTQPFRRSALITAAVGLAAAGHRDSGQ